jgi:hypothetical protein
MTKAKKSTISDHWDSLASNLREYMAQVTDERLKALCGTLYDAGWSQYGPYPLSTRNADQEVKRAVFEAIAVELSKRSREEAKSKG